MKGLWINDTVTGFGLGGIDCGQLRFKKGDRASVFCRLPKKLTFILTGLSFLWSCKVLKIKSFMVNSCELFGVFKIVM